MILKFVSKIIVFLLIILCISYSALYLYPDYKKEYVTGIVPKTKKLKEVKGPKIVVIGGSNASFGLDSEMIEKELRIPVVNMALHGGFPLKFIIEQVKPYLNKGDVLIMSREYEGLIGGDKVWNQFSGTEVPKAVTYNFSDAFVLFTDRILFETATSAVFNTIKLYLERYPFKGRGKQTSVYDYRSFRRDNIKDEWLEGEYTKEIKLRALKTPDSNSVVIRELKKYKQYFKNKGIKFYSTPPVVAEGHYKKEDILSFLSGFSKSTGIPLLNKDKTYVYKKTFFYNSYYHTNFKGRDIRTKSIIEDIIGLRLFKRDSNKLKTIFVAKKEKLNILSLKDFKQKHNFKVIERNLNKIHVQQDGGLKHNYFRAQFDNKDYKGYNFYLELECSENVIKNIKFRGTGLLENFDKIIPLANNNYILWKKVDKVFYKDDNSYIGIAFPDIELLKNAEFIVKDVGVFKDFGKDDVLTNWYDLDLNNYENVLFDIQSDNESVAFKDVISSEEQPKNIKFNANRIYQIVNKGGVLFFKDFYKNVILFEIKGDIIFKSSLDNTIRIY